MRYSLRSEAHGDWRTKLRKGLGILSFRSYFEGIIGRIGRSIGRSGLSWLFSRFRSLIGLSGDSPCIRPRYRLHHCQRVALLRKVNHICLANGYLWGWRLCRSGIQHWKSPWQTHLFQWGSTFGLKVFEELNGEHCCHYFGQTGHFSPIVLPETKKSPAAGVPETPTCCRYIFVMAFLLKLSKLRPWESIFLTVLLFIWEWGVAFLRNRLEVAGFTVLRYEVMLSWLFLFNL